MGLAMLTACVPTEAADPVAAPDYLGATASFLTDELVQIEVAMSAGAADEVLRRYADCVLAERMALRDVNFARHLRTLRAEEAGIRRADAVYTVSTVRPDGGLVLVGEEIRAACAAEGIPGV